MRKTRIMMNTGMVLNKNTMEPAVVPYEKSKYLELFTCTDEWGMNYRYLVRAYLADGVVLCD